MEEKERNDWILLQRIEHNMNYIEYIFLYEGSNFHIGIYWYGLDEKPYINA